MPHFEQVMPANLTRPGHQHWRAVTLSQESPWFVFVYRTKYGETKLPQSSLVAWEVTLLELVASVPPEDRVAIGRVDGASTTDAWAIRWLDALWEAAPDELQETGVLVQRLRGESEVRDVFLQAVGDREGRVQLFPGKMAADTSSEDERSVYSAVPEDFPAPFAAGAVAGAQAKMTVSLQGGVYTDGSQSQREGRFQVCQDLVNQLIAYTEHKLQERPQRRAAELVDQVLLSLGKKRFGWGLSPAEASWIAGRLRKHFGQSAPG